MQEFLGKSWEAKNKDVVAPNLSAFIAHFNRMGSWVATTFFDGVLVVVAVCDAR